MTDRAEIDTRVRKVLAEQLAVDEAQVVPDARFAEDLNADSLDLVEAVLALEEEWSIEIPEEEMESVKTVGQAIDLVATNPGTSPATLTGRSVVSNCEMRRTPLRPDVMPAQKSSTPMPTGATGPMPVTTTRRGSPIGVS